MPVHEKVGDSVKILIESLKSISTLLVGNQAVCKGVIKAFQHPYAISFRRYSSETHLFFWHTDSLPFRLAMLLESQL